MIDNVTHLALIKTAKEEEGSTEWREAITERFKDILQAVITKEYHTIVVVSLTNEGQIDTDIFGDEPAGRFTVAGMLEAAKMNALMPEDEYFDDE